MVDFAACEVTYKRIKSFILRVESDGTVKVSAPVGARPDQVEGFVKSKEAWIDQRLERLKDRPQFLSGAEIHLLGRRVPLKIEASEAERATWTSSGLVISSSQPEDSGYNQKLFYKKFTPMIERAMRSHLDALGGQDVTLKVRDMKRRWGTCFVGRQTIQLNKRLIHAPKDLIGYVIVHELTHFDHPDHGKGFYSSLEKALPDWKSKRKELNHHYGMYL